MAEESWIRARHSKSDLHDAANNSIDQECNRRFKHPWIASQSQVRLLRLKNNSSTNTSIPIESGLEIRNLSDLPHTDYVALSYCWGEARTEQDVRSIQVDGFSFAIRTNLSNFLRSDAALELRMPIYIDAICLNQLDLEERGNQVQLMSEVYKHASRTILWLGLCPREQGSNLESLRRRWADSESQDGCWDTESLVGLSFLCSRVYWRRLWIIQELYLSKTVDIHCGRFTFDLDTLVKLTLAPRSRHVLSDTQDAGWWDSWNMTRPTNYAEQSTQEDAILYGWHWAVRLIHNRAIWLASATMGGNNTPSPGLPFHHALMAFRHQQCREPRDKVYAILGLLDEEGRSMITPDYHCTEHALFRLAAVTCFVSCWRTKQRQASLATQNHEGRRYCDILSSTLGLGDIDIEAEMPRIMQEARSYIEETTGVTASFSRNRDTETHEQPELHLPPAADDLVTDRSLSDGQYLLRQAFRLFMEELSSAEEQEYALGNRKALDISLAFMQKRHRAKGAMRHMSRLHAFLEAMSAYEEVANSLLDIQNAVAYIWASIKFLLEVTDESPDAFNGLLKAYHTLGESIPALNHVQALPGGDDNHFDTVAHLFNIVFGFHRLALRYFRKPAWKQLFNATWKQLEMQLNGFSATLSEYKKLVDGRVQALDFGESRQHREQTNTQLAQLLTESNLARSQAEEAFKQLSADEVLRRRDRVINWLNAPDSLSDQDHGRSVRQCCPDSGRWLLNNPCYRRWNDTESNEAPLLWVNAIPGAGKSVIASLVVDESLPVANVATVFFYFKHDNSEKNTFLAMARCILHQLLQQDDNLLLYLFEMATKRGEYVLRTTKLAKEVLMACLNATGKVHAVLDGVDECDSKQQEHIANFWINHVEASRSAPHPCRCIMFSQDDASTRGLFVSIPTIGIGGEAHIADIRAYCMSWGEKIQSKFNLSWQETQWIVTQTKTRAQSMFLFAHVVMENLYEQVNQAELFQELERLPAELNDAYSRVVARVLTHAKLPLRRNAQQLLSWVICAIRPLKWREIQVAVSIDNEMGVVDLDNHRFRVGLKELCGALLDERPNGDVEVVHRSAEQYLLDQGYVDPALEHSRMTELCLNYFTLPAFSAECTVDQLHDHVKSGTYGFVEYAMVCWITHLEKAIDTNVGKDLPKTLTQVLETFFEQHWMPPQRRVARPTKRILELCNGISTLNICDRVKKTMSAMHFLMTTNSSKPQVAETLDLFTTLKRIRTALENSSAHEGLEEVYGPRLFKCPRIYCKWFSEGFSQADERRSHVDKHERSYLCSKPSCMYATIGFSKDQELSRHRETLHQISATDWSFPEARHDTAAGPSSQLARPPSRLHSFDSRGDSPEMVPSPRAEAQQPRGAEETQENDRGVAWPNSRRRKTVDEYPCTMCPRVFARSHNLRLHLRTHTNERPFSCSTCGRSFTRRNDCDRHEGLHSREDFVFMKPVEF